MERREEVGEERWRKEVIEKGEIEVHESNSYATRV